MQEDILRQDLVDGDPAVFQYLYDRYYVPLCLFANKFVRDKVAAEEVVHETFVRLWERRKYFEEVETISAYLYKSVRNQSLNYLKSLQIQHKHELAFQEKIKSAEAYFTITQETGQSVLIAQELERKILTAIEELPEQCREIFRLSRFVGLKNQEIAEKKQVTLNTVQKQISIALLKLRNALGDYLQHLSHWMILFCLFR